MKMLEKASVVFLLCLQLAGCGGSSKGDGDSPFPRGRGDAGFIDETAAAEVDLQGHVVFDQLVVPAFQESVLKDLARVERFDLDTGTDNDEALKGILSLADLRAGSLSAWLKERVQYILAEDLHLYRVGVVVEKDRAVGMLHFDPPEDPDENRFMMAAMVGTALYSRSKHIRTEHPEVSYMAIEVNDEWVHANTLRNGVMQIGPALFNPDFQPSPGNPLSYANTAARVGTLFHEARHADGNSESDSLGFAHIECPANAGVASELVGMPACDDSSNGAYSVGYRILRAYVEKCGRLCTAEDFYVLEAMMLDELSRVIPRDDGTLPELDGRPEVGLDYIDLTGFSFFPVVTE